MKHTILIVATAVALSATPGTSAQAPASSTAPVADQSFVKKLAQGGAAEIELSQLASQKAMNSEVKAFAQRMIDDHRKAGDELKGLAQRKNITISEELPADAKAAKERLSKLSGAAFDRAYMDVMLSDHRKVVTEVKAESQSGKDADVKAWAAKTLPTIEMHLMHAQEVHHAVQGRTATH